MKLKLLSSLSVLLLFTGCSSNSFFSSSYSEDAILEKHEQKFEKDIKKIFSQIDSNKEKIRTVSEKESFENRTVEKSNSDGGESFFRKNVLKRFKDDK